MATRADETEKPAVNPTRIYLVGFMGAGKTSVGLRLAELLGWKFLDLDQEIERQQGAPIRSIFREKGEAWFREIERRELERASTLTRCVIALGGGAFCNDDNRRIVESSGFSIWLDASIEIIYGRCAGDSARPLFASRPEMARFLEKRRPYYEKSRLRIEVGSMSIDAVARHILHALENNPHGKSVPLD